MVAGPRRKVIQFRVAGLTQALALTLTRLRSVVAD
jgi:hypothetical protein